MSRLIGTAPLASPPVLTISSRLSVGGAMAKHGMSAPATGLSPWSDAANCLLAFPFVLEANTTFYKGFWVNGSSAGGNTEVGIWDDSYNKIVTTGSVAGSGNSVPQSAAFASSVTPNLPPGRYYAGIAHDATTTNQFIRWAAAVPHLWQSMGCWRQAAISLGSLAATATPGDMSNAALPVFGLITRTVFDV